MGVGGFGLMVHTIVIAAKRILVECLPCIYKFTKIERKVGMRLPKAETKGAGILNYKVKVYPSPTDHTYWLHPLDPVTTPTGPTH